MNEIGKNEFEVECEIKNISDIAGYEVAQLYIRGYKNSILRRGKELRGFEKIYLNAGETKKVTFYLGYDELKIYSINQKYEVEDADVEIMVGSNPNLPLRAFIHTCCEEK